MAAKKILADHRLVLSGTPIENGVADLWSIMDFLMPGYLGSHKDFREFYELPILNGGSDERFADREMGFELYGFRAYRKGRSKILRLAEPYGTGEWQLYRLDEDPGEVRDLAGKQPDKVVELVEAWERWANENRVFPKPGK